MANRKFNRRGITVESVDYGHLRGRIDCEAVLEQLGIDMAFRPRPNQIMCRCPDLQGNHNNGDAHPSFGFSEDKLVYNCFQCGGGNIIELTQMMRPEFAPRFKNDIQKQQEALDWLEQFADFNKDDISDKIHAILNPKKDEKEAMPDYPIDNLFQYRKIHPYLYERGLTRDVIVDMQVGYDDEHFGIVIPHFFKGQLVGIQRRHILVDESGNFVCSRCGQDNKPVPKYKNTSHFPKVNTLYGYDHLRRMLKEGDGESVIVVESPMTALKLMSLGFNRVVATFGQFSHEQASLLMALPKVYFWPDNDKAGYENAQRCIDALGRFTRLMIVPVLDKEKGDAADLDDAKSVSEYLKLAYSASLFNLYTQNNNLPKLQDILTQNEH